MSLADQQWCPTSVQVTVLQARGLKIKGKGGTNDAFAVMQVGKEKYQTTVAEKSVAPVWKEEATFDLPQQQPGGGGGKERSTLHVQVLHRALVGPDKLLGQAVINLPQLSQDKTRSKTEWFKLLDKTGKADKDRGEVLVDVQFLRNNMTASMFDLSAAGKSKSRLGKFKDKVRGKKKDSEVASTAAASFPQVLTDSEDEEGNGDCQVAAGKDEEKKKKKKIKALFSPKTNLQKNMSQSMSVLPAKSSLSRSQSSGLNVDPSEGKKKFKFLIHKRSGSSGSRDSSSAPQAAAEPSSLCINGSHVYCEEPQNRSSRIGSSFSLASSGHGSMEDVPGSSPPSVDSLRTTRQYSPWTEEEEEEEVSEGVKGGGGGEAGVEKEKEAVVGGEDGKGMEEEERVLEEERRQEEEKRRGHEEMIRLEEERRKEEKRRLEEERARMEEEIRKQEERRRVEEEERRLEEMARKEEEIKREMERKRIEEEEARKEEEMRKELERRRVEEEERARKEEEMRKELERRRIEEEEARKEEEMRKELERRRIEEEEARKEEEMRKELERRRMEEEERERKEEEMRKELERRRMEEEERERKEEEMRKELERRRIEEEERERKEEEMRKELERRRIEEEERERKEEEMRKELERRRIEEEERERKEEERRKLEAEEKRRIEEESFKKEMMDRQEQEKIMQMEEQRRQQEEIRKEEEEKDRGNTEEERKTRSFPSEEPMKKVTQIKPDVVASLNPFDETFQGNPSLPAGTRTSQASECSDPHRTQPAGSLLRTRTSSSEDKDQGGSQREKRPAPQPPQKTSTQTSSLTLTLNQANHGKGPAPAKPPSGAKPSPTSNISKSRSPEVKQEPLTYSYNPFEDDEDDELTAPDEANSGSKQWPPAADSHAKIKSSKKARAPPLPEISDTCSSPVSLSPGGDPGRDPRGDSRGDPGPAGPDPDMHGAHLRGPCSISEAKPATPQLSGGKKDEPPTSKRRLLPVKPLNSLRQSVNRGEKDIKGIGILNDEPKKTKVDPELKGPYSQLTTAELISLVRKQEKQLLEKDAKISELEQYIDNLLVRVMEEQPTILMSINTLKKSV